MKSKLPRGWRNLWFFRVVSKNSLKNIAAKGLMPNYIIEPDPEISGHFNNLKQGLDFVKKYGDKVLFFTQTPDQAWNYARPQQNVTIRFPLPPNLDPNSIYEDMTGYFGVLKIPPEEIEVHVRGNWKTGIWRPLKRRKK